MILGAAPGYQLPHVAEIQIPLLHHELAEPMIQHCRAANLEIGLEGNWTGGQELVHLKDAEMLLAVPIRCLHHKVSFLNLCAHTGSKLA